MARPTKCCPKCREILPMTRHHIRPVRWYGKKKNHWGVLLCQSCHLALERIIHSKEKSKGQLAEVEYFYLVIQFLEDTTPS